ncbi:hypothetical protein CEXT_418081 [Caerostris extrusa]|uniref:Uncharacterized protein n=1 Tax=Caerostris extrusa TaxID=172846 RepID=A0AAV4WDA4_CAEEX|nr:hypothetical protein CEXT_418081 [Caerostris extrusa]
MKIFRIRTLREDIQIGDRTIGAEELESNNSILAPWEKIKFGRRYLRPEEGGYCIFTDVFQERQQDSVFTQNVQSLVFLFFNKATHGWVFSAKGAWPAPVHSVRAEDSEGTRIAVAASVIGFVWPRPGRLT